MKAAAIGAIAGALPDIDVFFSLTGDFVDQLVTHRGITHSLFFAPVAGPVLGWLVYTSERHKPDDGARRNLWMLVLTLALLSHPLLDLLTPYGTQLLQPFSNARFAINAMPIIDPAYTLLLLIGLLIAWRVSRRSQNPDFFSPLLSPLLSPGGVAATALALSSAYLGWGWWLNAHTESIAEQQLALRGIHAEQVAAFPTVLQIHYRRVVARLADRDMVGFYSNWSPCEIDWNSAPRDTGPLLSSYLESREGQVFDWFAMGWAHYETKATAEGHSLLVSDLRYGFDSNPQNSVFSLTTTLDGSGRVQTPILVGRSVPTDTGNSIRDLLNATYASACRFLQ